MQQTDSKYIPSPSIWVTRPRCGLPRDAWIPIKLRLPDERVVVWIYDAFDKKVKIGIRAHGLFFDVLKDMNQDDDMNITHWMPLEWPIAPECDKI